MDSNAYDIGVRIGQALPYVLIISGLTLALVALVVIILLLQWAAKKLR